MRRARTVLAALFLPLAAQAADEAAEAPPPPPPPPLEGAVGLIVERVPSYSGAGDKTNKAIPAFYLRYGRFMVTNAGVFVTRRQKDDVFRGISADLVRSDALRVNFALRVDNGRSTSDSPRLAGLDDVRGTIRGRLLLQWQIAEDWRFATGLAPDLLGRGGGIVLDAGVSREFRLDERSTVVASGGLSFANARYMRSYYGVTPAQSLTTGYTAYEPGAGLRDAGLGLTWRAEIGERWIAFAGGSVSRLLGPPVDSPLTQSRNGWALNGGLAWRF